MIEINYCEPCGDFEQAEKLQDMLLASMDLDMNDVNLIPCQICGFRVRVGNQTVHSEEINLHDKKAIVGKVQAEMA